MYVYATVIPYSNPLSWCLYCMAIFDNVLYLYHDVGEWLELFALALKVSGSRQIVRGIFQKLSPFTQ